MVIATTLPPTLATDKYTQIPSSALPTDYRPASSWLTFPEWKRLRTRADDRARWAGEKEALTLLDFYDVVTGSKLKEPVQRTLLFMMAHADSRGYTYISKARIASKLGITTKTVQRHWAIAVDAGFLLKYDYPQCENRTSDLWLFPGNAPTVNPHVWEKFESMGEMQDSTGPVPF